MFKRQKKSPTTLVINIARGLTDQETTVLVERIKKAISTQTRAY